MSRQNCHHLRFSLRNQVFPLVIHLLEDGDENIVYVKLIRRSVLISTTGIYRFRLHALSRERDRNRTCFHRCSSISFSSVHAVKAKSAKNPVNTISFNCFMLCLFYPVYLTGSPKISPTLKVFGIQSSITKSISSLALPIVKITYRDSPQQPSPHLPALS